jgi:outer membrane protein W
MHLKKGRIFIMKRITIFLVVFALALTCGTAFAKDIAMQKGASEIGIFTSIDTSESYATDFPESKSVSESTDLDLRYGYFLTDGLQLGVSYMAMLSKDWQEENGSKVDGSESTSEMNFLYLDVKYNFIFSQSQTVVPYLGLGLGTASSKMESDSGTTKGSGTAVALMGGVKFFMTENTSLNAELRMDEFTFDTDFGGQSYEFTTETVGMNLGLSVYF